jgi:hypothetical protein
MIRVFQRIRINWFFFFFSDIEALRMVDEAYQNREEWIKKSIRTTAKVRSGKLGVKCELKTGCADGQV